MATEHTLLRSAIDSLEEAVRLLSRYEKRDIGFVFNKDDMFSIRSAAVMSAQGAKAIAECSGYIEALLYSKHGK